MKYLLIFLVLTSLQYAQSKPLGNYRGETAKSGIQTGSIGSRSQSRTFGVQLPSAFQSSAEAHGQGKEETSSYLSKKDNQGEKKRLYTRSGIQSLLGLQTNGIFQQGGAQATFSTNTSSMNHSSEQSQTEIIGNGVLSIPISVKVEPLTLALAQAQAQGTGNLVLGESQSALDKSHGAQKETQLTVSVEANAAQDAKKQMSAGTSFFPSTNNHTKVTETTAAGSQKEIALQPKGEAKASQATTNQGQGTTEISASTVLTNAQTKVKEALGLNTQAQSATRFQKEKALLVKEEAKEFQGTKKEGSTGLSGSSIPIITQAQGKAASGQNGSGSVIVNTQAQSQKKETVQQKTEEAKASQGTKERGPIGTSTSSDAIMSQTQGTASSGLNGSAEISATTVLTNAQTKGKEALGLNTQAQSTVGSQKETAQLVKEEAKESEGTKKEGSTGLSGSSTPINTQAQGKAASGQNGGSLIVNTQAQSTVGSQKETAQLVKEEAKGSQGTKAEGSTGLSGSSTLINTQAQGKAASGQNGSGSLIVNTQAESQKKETVQQKIEGAKTSQGTKERGSKGTSTSNDAFMSQTQRTASSGLNGSAEISATTVLTNAQTEGKEASGQNGSGSLIENTKAESQKKETAQQKTEEAKASQRTKEKGSKGTSASSDAIMSQTQGTAYLGLNGSGSLKGNTQAQSTVGSQKETRHQLKEEVKESQGTKKEGSNITSASSDASKSQSQSTASSGFNVSGSLKVNTPAKSQEKDTARQETGEAQSAMEPQKGTAQHLKEELKASQGTKIEGSTEISGSSAPMNTQAQGKAASGQNGSGSLIVNTQAQSTVGSQKETAQLVKEEVKESQGTKERGPTGTSNSSDAIISQTQGTLSSGLNGPGSLKLGTQVQSTEGSQRETAQQKTEEAKAYQGTKAEGSTGLSGSTTPINTQAKAASGQNKSGSVNVNTQAESQKKEVAQQKTEEAKASQGTKGDHTETSASKAAITSQPIGTASSGSLKVNTQAQSTVGSQKETAQQVNEKAKESQGTKKRGPTGTSTSSDAIMSQTQGTASSGLNGSGSLKEYTQAQSTAESQKEKPQHMKEEVKESQGTKKEGSNETSASSDANKSPTQATASLGFNGSVSLNEYTQAQSTAESQKEKAQHMKEEVKESQGTKKEGSNETSASSDGIKSQAQGKAASEQNGSGYLIVNTKAESQKIEAIQQKKEEAIASQGTKERSATGTSTFSDAFISQTQGTKVKEAKASQGTKNEGSTRLSGSSTPINTQAQGKAASGMNESGSLRVNTQDQSTQKSQGSQKETRDQLKEEVKESQGTKKRGSNETSASSDAIKSQTQGTESSGFNLSGSLKVNSTTEYQKKDTAQQKTEEAKASEGTKERGPTGTSTSNDAIMPKTQGTSYSGLHGSESLKVNTQGQSATGPQNEIAQHMKKEVKESQGTKKVGSTGISGSSSPINTQAQGKAASGQNGSGSLKLNSKVESQKKETGQKKAEEAKASQGTKEGSHTGTSTSSDAIIFQTQGTASSGSFKVNKQAQSATGPQKETPQQKTKESKESQGTKNEGSTGLSGSNASIDTQGQRTAASGQNGSGSLNVNTQAGSHIKETAQQKTVEAKAPHVTIISGSPAISGSNTLINTEAQVKSQKKKSPQATEEVKASQATKKGGSARTSDFNAENDNLPQGKKASGLLKVDTQAKSTMGSTQQATDEANASQTIKKGSTGISDSNAELNSTAASGQNGSGSLIVNTKVESQKKETGQQKTEEAKASQGTKAEGSTGLSGSSTLINTQAEPQNKETAEQKREEAKATQGTKGSTGLSGSSTLINTQAQGKAASGQNGSGSLIVNTKVESQKKETGQQKTEEAKASQGTKAEGSTGLSGSSTLINTQAQGKAASGQNGSGSLIVDTQAKSTMGSTQQATEEANASQNIKKGSTGISDSNAELNSTAASGQNGSGSLMVNTQAEPQKKETAQQKIEEAKASQGTKAEGSTGLSGSSTPINTQAQGKAVSGQNGSGSLIVNTKAESQKKETAQYKTEEAKASQGTKAEGSTGLSGSSVLINTQAQGKAASGQNGSGSLIVNTQAESQKKETALQKAEEAKASQRTKGSTGLSGSSTSINTQAYGKAVSGQNGSGSLIVNTQAESQKKETDQQKIEEVKASHGTKAEGSTGLSGSSTPINTQAYGKAVSGQNGSGSLIVNTQAEPQNKETAEQKREEAKATQGTKGSTGLSGSNTPINVQAQRKAASGINESGSLKVNSQAESRKKETAQQKTGEEKVSQGTKKGGSNETSASSDAIMSQTQGTASSGLNGSDHLKINTLAQSTAGSIQLAKEEGKASQSAKMGDSTGTSGSGSLINSQAQGKSATGPNGSGSLKINTQAQSTAGSQKETRHQLKEDLKESQGTKKGGSNESSASSEAIKSQTQGTASSGFNVSGSLKVNISAESQEKDTTQQKTEVAKTSQGTKESGFKGTSTSSDAIMSQTQGTASSGLNGSGSLKINAQAQSATRPQNETAQHVKEEVKASEGTKTGGSTGISGSSSLINNQAQGKAASGPNGSGSLKVNTQAESKKEKGLQTTEEAKESEATKKGGLTGISDSNAAFNTEAHGKPSSGQNGSGSVKLNTQTESQKNETVQQATKEAKASQATKKEVSTGTSVSSTPINTQFQGTKASGQNGISDSNAAFITEAHGKPSSGQNGSGSLKLNTQTESQKNETVQQATKEAKASQATKKEVSTGTSVSSTPINTQFQGTKASGQNGSDSLKVNAQAQSATRPQNETAQHVKEEVKASEGTKAEGSTGISGSSSLINNQAQGKAASGPNGSGSLKVNTQAESKKEKGLQTTEEAKESEATKKGGLTGISDSNAAFNTEAHGKPSSGQNGSGSLKLNTQTESQKNETVQQATKEAKASQATKKEVSTGTSVSSTPINTQFQGTKASGQNGISDSNAAFITEAHGKPSSGQNGSGSVKLNTQTESQKNETVQQATKEAKASQATKKEVSTGTSVSSTPINTQFQGTKASGQNGSDSLKVNAQAQSATRPQNETAQHVKEEIKASEGTKAEGSTGISGSSSLINNQAQGKAASGPNGSGSLKVNTQAESKKEKGLQTTEEAKESEATKKGGLTGISDSNAAFNTEAHGKPSSGQNGSGSLKLNTQTESQKNETVQQATKEAKASQATKKEVSTGTSVSSTPINTQFQGTKASGQNGISDSNAAFITEAHGKPSSGQNGSGSVKLNTQTESQKNETVQQATKEAKASQATKKEVSTGTSVSSTPINTQFQGTKASGQNGSDSLKVNAQAQSATRPQNETAQHVKEEIKASEGTKAEGSTGISGSSSLINNQAQGKAASGPNGSGSLKVNTQAESKKEKGLQTTEEAKESEATKKGGLTGISDSNAAFNTEAHGKPSSGQNGSGSLKLNTQTESQKNETVQQATKEAKASQATKKEVSTGTSVSSTPINTQFQGTKASGQNGISDSNAAFITEAHGKPSSGQNGSGSVKLNTQTESQKNETVQQATKEAKASQATKKEVSTGTSVSSTPINTQFQGTKASGQNGISDSNAAFITEAHGKPSSGQNGSGSLKLNTQTESQKNETVQQATKEAKASQATKKEVSTGTSVSSTPINTQFQGTKASGQNRSDSLKVNAQAQSATRPQNETAQHVKKEVKASEGTKAEGSTGISGSSSLINNQAQGKAASGPNGSGSLKVNTQAESKKEKGLQTTEEAKESEATKKGGLTGISDSNAAFNTEAHGKPSSGQNGSGSLKLNTQTESQKNETVQQATKEAKASQATKKEVSTGTSVSSTPINTQFQGTKASGQNGSDSLMVNAQAQSATRPQNETAQHVKEEVKASEGTKAEGSTGISGSSSLINNQAQGKAASGPNGSGSLKVNTQAESKKEKGLQTTEEAKESEATKKGGLTGISDSNAAFNTEAHGKPSSGQNGSGSVKLNTQTESQKNETVQQATKEAKASQATKKEVSTGTSVSSTPINTQFQGTKASGQNGISDSNAAFITEAHGKPSSGQNGSGSLKLNTQTESQKNETVQQATKEAKASQATKKEVSTGTSVSSTPINTQFQGTKASGQNGSGSLKDSLKHLGQVAGGPSATANKQVQGSASLGIGESKSLGLNIIGQSSLKVQNESESSQTTLSHSQVTDGSAGASAPVNVQSPVLAELESPGMAAQTGLQSDATGRPTGLNADLTLPIQIAEGGMKVSQSESSHSTSSSQKEIVTSDTSSSVPLIGISADSLVPQLGVDLGVNVILG